MLHYVAGGGTKERINLYDICKVCPANGTMFLIALSRNKRTTERTKEKDDLSTFDVGYGKKLDVTGKHCFSIIFKDDQMPLALVTDNTNIRNYWVSLV